MDCGFPQIRDLMSLRPIHLKLHLGSTLTIMKEFNKFRSNQSNVESVAVSLIMATIQHQGQVGMVCDSSESMILIMSHQ